MEVTFICEVKYQLPVPFIIFYIDVVFCFAECPGSIVYHIFHRSHVYGVIFINERYG